MKNLIEEIINRVYGGPIPGQLRPDTIFSTLSASLTLLKESVPDVDQIISFNLIGTTVTVVYINNNGIEVEEPLRRFTK